MTRDAKSITTALFERAREGDQSAEHELFSRLRARFDWIARQKVRYAEDCEDIVQEALASIAGCYREIEIRVSFSAWAATVLRNQIMDYYRSSERRRTDNLENPDSVVLSGETTDPLLKKHLLDCLRKVNQANRRHARMLVLKYMGFEFSEICAKLKLKRNNAYSVLNRARTMLEDCLDKKRQLI